jgi:pimeloyl-ACP methyl ester carboxylesterase
MLRYTVLTFLPAAVVALATTNPNVMRSPNDLTRAFRDFYTDLERPALRSVQASPTLRFSYVSPPAHNNIRSKTWQSNTAHVDAEIPLTTTEESTVQDHPLKPDSSSKKPVALYLPGLDGYGISAAMHQFGDLADAFELWRFTVLPADRSSFSQVVAAVADFIVTLDHPVTLIGESCGGMFAAAVAIRLASHPHALQGLVLVNPATSFDKTLWETLVPVLTSLDNNIPTSAKKNGTALTPYAVIGSLLLAAIIPDADQSRRITDSILNLPVASRNPSEMYQAVTDSFRVTKERLDPVLLEHRVSQWLVAGTAAVNARLGQISTTLPVLVVVGAQDKVLPSVQEAARLKRLLPHNSVETLVVEDRGHFVLDENVNLTEAILYSKVDPYNWKETKKAYDPIADWKLPSDVDAYVQRQVQPLITACSPVYFSTDPVGKRWMGMGKIPRSDNRPLLFVGNHQFGT